MYGAWDLNGLALLFFLLPFLLMGPALLGTALTALTSWLMVRGKRGTQNRMFALGLVSTAMGYILAVVSLRPFLKWDWVQAGVPYEDNGYAVLAVWYFGCVTIGVLMILVSAAWCWFRPRYRNRQPQSENS